MLLGLAVTKSRTQSGVHGVLRTTRGPKNVRRSLATGESPKVIVIGGPTAVGKSKLSMSLVNSQDGVLVNADATKVYRGLDCGANKRAIKGVSVRLWDLVDPFHSEFSAGQYHDIASAEIDSIINKEHKTPIVVGGSGLYIRWLLRGKQAGPRRDAERSTEIFNTIKDLPFNEVLDRIRAFDPIYAERLSGKDYRRAARAIELNERTGETIGSLQRQRTGALHDEIDSDIAGTSSGDSGNQTEGLWQKTIDFRPFLLQLPRVDLYDQICVRCEKMILDGLFVEVWGLMKRGLTADSTAGKAIGYRQSIDFLNRRQFDEKNFMEFLIDFQSKSRQLAHRQLAWFRKEPDFVPIDLLPSTDHAHDQITSLLALSKDDWIEYVKRVPKPSEESIQAEMAALKLYQPPVGLFILPRPVKRLQTQAYFRLKAERQQYLDEQLSILKIISREMDRIRYQPPSSSASSPV